MAPRVHLSGKSACREKAKGKRCRVTGTPTGPMVRRDPSDQRHWREPSVGEVGDRAGRRETERGRGPAAYAREVGVSQPRSMAWRTMSTRLRSLSFAMERVLKVSTVFTLRLSWTAISLFA